MGLFVGQAHARRWFEFLASRYNFINRFIYTEKMRRQLLAEVEDGRVLDVGVGTGYTTWHLENSVGIDITLEMIRQAKKRYLGSLVLADAAHPPFKNKSFSTIISAGSLYYIPNPDSTLRAFNRLLKDDGVILTITPSLRILKPFVQIFSSIDLKVLFEKTGFTMERIVSQRNVAYFCKARKGPF